MPLEIFIFQHSCSISGQRPLYRLTPKKDSRSQVAEYSVVDLALKSPSLPFPKGEPQMVTL